MGKEGEIVDVIYNQKSDEEFLKESNNIVQWIYFIWYYPTNWKWILKIGDFFEDLTYWWINRGSKS
jgi:hypothetical protein